MKNPVLNRVRLININANANNLNDVYKLIKVGGIDENGNNLTKAVVPANCMSLQRRIS